MQNSFLCIKQSKHMGRGLYARRDIPSGSVLLTVPQHRFITFSNLKDHPLFFQLEHEVQVSKMVLFACFMAYCSRAPHLLHSQMGQIVDYLSKLPAILNNLIIWEEGELKLLNNQELVRKVQQRRNAYLQDFQKLQKVIQLKQTANLSKQEQQQSSLPLRGGRRRRTYEKKQQDSHRKEELSELMKVQFSQILKMIASIQSRNIYYQTFYDSKSEVGALIPFLDFFNHSANAQCQVELSCEYEKVYATRSICKGEQVYVNYGKNISLQQFLQFYGMIPEQYHPKTLKQNLNANISRGQQPFGKDAEREGDGNSNKRRKLTLIFNESYDLKKAHEGQQGKDPLSPIQSFQI